MNKNYNLIMAKAPEGSIKCMWPLSRTRTPLMAGARGAGAGRAAAGCGGDRGPRGRGVVTAAAPRLSTVLCSTHSSREGPVARRAGSLEPWEAQGGAHPLLSPRSQVASALTCTPRGQRGSTRFPLLRRHVATSCPRPVPGLCAPAPALRPRWAPLLRAPVPLPRNLQTPAKCRPPLQQPQAPPRPPPWDPFWSPNLRTSLFTPPVPKSIPRASYSPLNSRLLFPTSCSTSPPGRPLRIHTSRV